jgi:hypothetical protein
MPQQRKLASTAPPDLGAFWGIDDATLARANESYRTWLEAGEAIQRQALEFMQGRITKNSEAFAQLAKCTNPQELLELQAGFTRDAIADLVTNSRRIAACIEDAARKGTSGTQ